MRRSLFSLLGIIALWSLFYAGIKYYFWGTYAPDFAPSLESISGYVLIGSMIAYTVGGFLYARFSERFMLFVAIGVGLGSFLSASVLPQFSPVLFNVSMIGIGLAYSLYVIGKNTLIGREIATSHLGSSTIGAFTTIIFIVSLVLGTILGATLGEGTGIVIGILYFMILLVGVSIVLFFTETKKGTGNFHFSL